MSGQKLASLILAGTAFGALIFALWAFFGPARPSWDSHSDGNLEAVTKSDGGAIALAVEREGGFNATRESAGQMGIICSVTEREACHDLVARVKANPALRDAILLAKSRGVGVFADDHFEVSSGWVLVDVGGSSDEEIVAWLTGEDS